MHLKNNEIVVKIFHHHYFTHILRELKIAILSFPFFLVASFFSTLLTPAQMFGVYAGIAFFFALAIAYDAILYWLDRLIITNMRVLYIDWQNPFSRSEHEADMIDIQDIETKESGILSNLPVFDFGHFSIRTASAGTVVIFNEAPDPEGIKHFIYHLNVKPNRIGPVSISKNEDDKARQSVEEASAVTRRQ